MRFIRSTMRFIRRPTNPDEPKATEANTGEEDEEEEEETLAPPPPMAKKAPAEEPKKEDGVAEPPPPAAAPAKELSGADALTAPPSFHSLIVRRPAAKTAAQPPQMLWTSGAAPTFAGAVGAVNPNAPRGFAAAATVPMNPNAPRGAAEPRNPNAPRAFNRGERKPPASIAARGPPFATAMPRMAAQLEQRVLETVRVAKAREEEFQSRQVAEAAQRERVEAENAQLKQPLRAASDEAQRKSQEAQQKSEEDRRLLLAKLEAEVEKREGLERCARALEQRFGGLEQTGLETKTLEEKLASVSERAANAEKDLSEALSKIAALEEKLRAVPQPAQGGGLGESGDAFDLPEVVWNCGNTEVMAFVQKIVAETAALKQQQASTSAPGQGGDARADSGAPFSTGGVDASGARAFASTITESDGHQVKPFLDLLREHRGDMYVCSQVFEALETLTFTSTENRRTIVQHGGIEAIMDVLEQHENIDGALSRPGIDALWSLTFGDDAVDNMSEAGGIDRITAIMRKHDSLAELQGGACAVLQNLAVREPNRWKIVRSGAIDLIAAAMQRHCNSEEVLELGCQALYMLACHQDLRPLVLAAKGSEAVSCATSYSCGRMQKWGRFLQEVLAC